MHLRSGLDTYFNKYTHRIVLYVLVYDQDKDNLKDFRNEMSFRVTFVSVVQLYKPLTENTSTVSIPIDFKWEHRKILQIIVNADFVNY